MPRKPIREGGKFRITLGEMAVGIALLAIPLAYWNSNVRGFRSRPLSPSAQKMLAENPQFIFDVYGANVRNDYVSLLACKLNAYVLMACSAFAFIVFLVVRRSGFVEGHLRQIFRRRSP